MKISLHNTLLRRKQEFVPIDENNVRMYVCGPTVYDRAHLGNAKTSVVFDVLYRFLCQVYGKDHVTYVSNITDVDDKILNKHKETGKSIREITEQSFQWYLDDMKKLNVLNPNHRRECQKNRPTAWNSWPNIPDASPDGRSPKGCPNPAGPPLTASTK